MKFAVCSISSTASRKPPSVMRGMPAVATRPTGFRRRSSILFASLHGRVQLVQNDARKLALRITKRCDDVFHGFVDIEAERQHRDDAVDRFEQLAVVGFPRQ